MKKITLEFLKNKLEKEEGLYPRKHNPLTLGRWETFEDPEEDYGSVSFKKNLGRKGYGKIRVRAMDLTDEGLETIIELTISSGDWEVFFEGFLEYEEDIDTIFRLIGI